LRSQHVEVELPFGARLELREFGEPAILVDGVAMPRPRIGKSYELLALLIARSSRTASRDELLTGLFGGRSDSSARSYLRQAVHHLREVLPDEVRLESNPARVSLDPAVSVTSESARLERLLAEAGRLQGHERLEVTLDAIGASERGEYLEGLSSRFTEERRERLTRLITEARYDAAELGFAAGRYTEALRLVETILARDPFREAAHRLEMRIANAIGDEDRVIAAFRRCEETLSRLGTAPSATTRQLLETLRR
jgi:DNA-binding SARP family transcriptional activator